MFANVGRINLVGCLNLFLDIICLVFGGVLQVWGMSPILIGKSFQKGWVSYFGKRRDVRFWFHDKVGVSPLLGFVYWSV